MSSLRLTVASNFLPTTNFFRFTRIVYLQEDLLPTNGPSIHCQALDMFGFAQEEEEEIML
jgi:hypothetical protein